MIFKTPEGINEFAKCINPKDFEDLKDVSDKIESLNNYYFDSVICTNMFKDVYYSEEVYENFIRSKKVEDKDICGCRIIEVYQDKGCGNIKREYRLECFTKVDNVHIYKKIYDSLFIRSHESYRTIKDTYDLNNIIKILNKYNFSRKIKENIISIIKKKEN